MGKDSKNIPSSGAPIVLVAEDDSFQGELITRVLDREGLAHHVVVNGQRALDYLAAHPAQIAVVILDINMPVLNGLQAFEIIKGLYPDLPVVFLTGDHDVNHAVQAIKDGAYDFLTKPIDRDRFSITVRNAYRQGCMARSSGPSKWRSSSLRLSDLIGHDGALRDVCETARKLAATDVPIMIGGETGTGKDVLARAIHGESPRGDRPFVALNCGAIPENLIESILFGHEKGAFTGATERTPGKFREAEGGTIFLDEIGDMPMNAQVRLLRVLQQHEVQPVGSAKAVPIDVRVISASNRDLSALVRAGRFREDLLYRLNVVPIHLPPLRQRVGDIPRLVDHFITRYAVDEGLPIRAVTPDAISTLVAYLWPGNVRELENVVRRALVLGSGDALYPYDFVLGPADVAPVAPEIGEAQPLVSSFGPTVPVLGSDGQVRAHADIEADVYRLVLKHCGGNIQRAATLLGVARSTFYRKLSV